MNLKECLSSNLRHLRTSKNLSQMELAEAADLSLNLISETERGLKWPRPATLEALAKALKVKPSELLLDDSIVLKRATEALKDGLK